MTAQRLGRLVVDDKGIRQRRVLGLFGETFDVAWHDLTGWWVVDQLLQQASTGGERLAGHALGLECAGTLHVVSRPAGDEGFQRLVQILRLHAPDRERPGGDSPLAQVGRARG